MVDWYYIFSILPLGVYPCSPYIYNVVKLFKKFIYCKPVSSMKKLGHLLIRRINPGGEHGRDRSHIANQDRKGKRSDQESPRRSGWIVTTISVFSILY